VTLLDRKLVIVKDSARGLGRKHAAEEESRDKE
jgi:hypothetical protein